MRNRGKYLLDHVRYRLKGLPISMFCAKKHVDGYLCVSAKMSLEVSERLKVKSSVLYADISMSGLTRVKGYNRPTTLFNMCSFYMKDDQDLNAPAVELDKRVWLDFEAVHKGVLRDMLFGIDEHDRSRNVEELGYYRPTVMFNATDEDFVYGLVSDFFMRYCHK